MNGLARAVFFGRRWQFWEHVNFLGEYSFDVNVQFGKDNLRKLNI